MLKHYTLCEEMYSGKKKYKRTFNGHLFGKIGLKNLLKDETPLKRNSPTGPEFKITEKDGDVFVEKKKQVSLIEEYAQYSNNNFEHWFFGK